MIASIENMRATFIICNNRYFGGRLPMPYFKVIHTYRVCAQFQHDYDRFGGREFYNPTILVTDYFDFTPKEYVDVMCHEMVHYYLAYFEIDRSLEHGKDFFQMVNYLNWKYHLHITKEGDMATLKRNPKAPLLKYWLSRMFC